MYLKKIQKIIINHPWAFTSVYIIYLLFILFLIAALELKSSGVIDMDLINSMRILLVLLPISYLIAIWQFRQRQHIRDIIKREHITVIR